MTIGPFRIASNRFSNNLRSSIVLAALMVALLPAVAAAQPNPTYSTARALAPGVLKEIPPKLDARDSFTLPMKLPGLELRTYEPQQGSVDDTLFGQGSRVVLFRDVWQYDFAFTGLRQARLTIGGPDGSVSQRNVWYLVYRVRDTGQSLTYDQVKQNPDFDLVTYNLKRGEEIPREKRFFLPRFTLEGSVYDGEKKQYQRLSYRDTIDPVALKQIQKLEDPGQMLLDPTQMSEAMIPRVKPESEAGLWGVAIFENVNPDIDFVSVFVNGLTNAYRIAGNDADVSFQYKTLQLNFWRPGDSVNELEDSVTYGIPLVDDPRKQVLIARQYRLPGPLIKGYEINEAANREVLVIEADAMVDLKTFKSAIAPTLDGGKLPASVVEAFAAAGITVNPDVKLESQIEGAKWSFSQGEKRYVLKLAPQYWEPTFNGIRFIKSLDHMWIYR